MSLGPELDENEQIKVPFTSKVKAQLKPIIKSFSLNPLENLFHLFLFIGMTSLVIGFKPAWEFYALLVLTEILNLYKGWKDQQHNS